MSVNETTEKRFESDIEAAFLSPVGGYVKGTDTYDQKLGLYVNTLIDFIRKRLFDEQELARQDKPLSQEAEREAKNQFVEAKEIKRARDARIRRKTTKNYMED